MAHRNGYGRYILSAGEIASYTVCPEAWRLREIQHVDSLYVDTIKKGKDLHHQWAAGVNEAMFLTWSVRLILLLITLVLLVFVATFSF